MIFESRYPPVPIRDISVTDRLFEGLAISGDRVVLTCGATGYTLTGTQLRDRIQRLAGGLTARGFGAGHTVAIMAPNLPDYATAFHAVAWAGGTVTTANPTYTATELRHQLVDSGAELLITVPPFLDTAREAVKGTQVSEIAVIGEAEGVPSLDDLMGDPIPEQVPVDLARHVVVLPYSSGTTGLPKGVMLTHRNLVVNIDQTVAVIEVAPGEVTTAFLPFFHIYGQTVLMNMYPAAGGGVVTMPRFDLELFLRLCQDYRTPRAFAVPPVMIALARHPMVDQFDLSALRMIASAAAPADAELTEAVGKRLGLTALQGYGMTELSPVSHFVQERSPRPGSVGTALPNTDCRIVDPETGRDLGVGEEGELWVRGPQVMLGYLNNDKATAETIVEGEWLRTGDLAAVDEDGYYYIRDRLKELIKYKGFQVAPAEVEAALLTLPQVADAAVIGAPDDEAGEVPVAFVVAAPDAAKDADAIRAALDGTLVAYKIPRRITFIDAIPKSASGKILRRQLRQA